MRSSRILLAFLVVLLAVPALLLAQTSTTSVLLGTVTDPTGAVVPGASVELTNLSTNQSATVSTNASGRYVFARVFSGTYSLSVSMQGFRTTTIGDVKVDVAKSYTYDVSLEVGAVTQVVEITSTARVELQTTDATIGLVIGRSELENLPTLGRQAQELFTLQPGVMPATGGASGGAAVTGARSDQNSFFLDGIDITENSIAGGTAVRTIIPISVENIEEFRVGVANPNATFGRAGGGQVSVITSSGTNDYHGAVFWFHQNDNLNATVWQNNRTIAQSEPDRQKQKKLQKPELKDNRFGFRVGGPIWREKTFFFLNYEGRRFPRTSQITRLVPTTSLRNGFLTFTDAAGNDVQYNLATAAVCDTTANQLCDPRGLGLSPTISALWSLLPAGNDPSGGDGLNTINFRGNVGTALENDFYAARVDHNITDKWRFNAAIRYFGQIQNSSTQVDIRGGNVISPRVTDNRGNMISTSVDGQITNSLFGQFRFGWVRDRSSVSPMRPNAVASALAIPGTNTSAGFIALDLGAGGGTQSLLGEPIDVGTQVARKQSNDNTPWQWVADMTWLKGNHNIQFGSHIRYIETLHLRDDKVLGALGALVAQIDADIGASVTIPDSARPPTCGGAITTNCIQSGDTQQWNRLYAASLGLLDQITVMAVRDGDFNPLPFGEQLESDTNLWAPEFYVQDTWRLTPSLTVTFGLNYGWQTAPQERLGRQTFIIDNTNGNFLTARGFLDAKQQAALSGSIFSPELGYVPVNSSNRSGIFETDTNNWGPRASAAWNPSFTGGFWGKLFGDRKTVLRGGYSLFYDRQNTVQSVIIPALGVGFAQTLNLNGPLCDATGTPGTLCNTAGSDPLSIFRVGVDGDIPVPTVPAQSIPVVPTGIFPEVLSFQGDPEIKVGENHAFDITVQRELPGNMIMEIGYVARLGRKLPQSINFNSVPYFHVDSASGQSFAQAFDIVATEIRNGVSGANVTAQPWFENNFPGGTAALMAAAGTSSFLNGNLSNLFQTIDITRFNAGLPTFNSLQALSMFMRTSVGESNYNGLLVSLRKRMSRGLTFALNYTWSKSLDTVGSVQNSAGIVPNSFDLNVSRGPSFFDRTHVLNANWQYELPFHPANATLSKVVGGWYVGGIFRSNSGLPLLVSQGGQVWGGDAILGNTTGAIPLVDPGSFSNSVQTGVTGSNNIGVNSDAADGGTGLNLFSNPEAVFDQFRRVLIAVDGRTGRANPLRGMPRWNLDLSLGKKTSIKEKVTIGFVLQFFNIFNHVDFNNPSLSLTSTRGFGTITSQFLPPNRSAGSRWIQFGLRVEF